MLFRSWTLDEWQIIDETAASVSGLEIYYVDIPVSMQQRAPIRFTFFWPKREQWENRDYEVRVL